MRHVGSILGYALAGIFVMSVWGFMAGKYGIIGGWFAATLIIGMMWYMNHFVGIITNDGAWVDMALGIAIVGTMRDVFLKGAKAGVDSMPTLLFVAIGGILGGIAAAAIQKHFAKKS